MSNEILYHSIEILHPIFTETGVRFHIDGVLYEYSYQSIVDLSFRAFHESLSEKVADSRLKKIVSNLEKSVSVLNELKENKGKITGVAAENLHAGDIVVIDIDDSTGSRIISRLNFKN